MHLMTIRYENNSFHEHDRLCMCMCMCVEGKKERIALHEPELIQLNTRAARNNNTFLLFFFRSKPYLRIAIDCAIYT